MADDFKAFIKRVAETQPEKVGQATSLIWWAEHRDGKASLSMNEICAYFDKARLPQPNTTRLDGDLRRSRFVKRVNGKRFQLSHEGIQEGVSSYPEFVPVQHPSDLISELTISACPYIDENDIADAKKMAELYVALFFLENSLRRHIERILSQSFGIDWWEKTASSSMKRKEQDRRKNEEQNKWIPTRSDAGPLYSLDWSDLVTLIRKHESIFLPTIGDINFLHRFSDLGNLRNVVAHNGVIDEQMQFERVKLAFFDWAKQVTV